MRVTLRGETSINMNGSTAPVRSRRSPHHQQFHLQHVGKAHTTRPTAPSTSGTAGDINPKISRTYPYRKGPAATALYRIARRKRRYHHYDQVGRTTKGIGVTFSSSVSFEKAGFWPDFQYEYGAGRFGNPYSFYSVDGVSRNWSSYAFGDKFDGHLTYEWPSLNTTAPIR